MRLRSKLVLAATGATFAIVLALSALFLAELERERVAQTGVANEVMVRQVLMITRSSLESGLRANPPLDPTPQAFSSAVSGALQANGALQDTMDSYVRYSPAVQDVSVTDATGMVLMSTDPQMLNQPIPARVPFSGLRKANVLRQVREVFGQPRVLGVEAPLNRNGQPFLLVQAGIRSTFLKESYVPYLEDGLLFVLVCGVLTMVAAALLTSVALRPMEEISRRLELLSAGAAEADLSGGGEDAVVRVSQSLDRRGEKMRSTQAGYISLQSNLNQMLDTLRDGVVLFTAERRAAMVSDAVALFLPVSNDGDVRRPLVGMALAEMFSSGSILGRAILEAFDLPMTGPPRSVLIEDGREVEFSLGRIPERLGDGDTGTRKSTLLTLRDRGSALRLEQELEVSRRLAAVGRLTAGVGHEVKNPINAMVVHLELLRSKLEQAGEGRAFLAGTMRHVHILAGEMQRLDRVVQTLADFTKPLELGLQVLDLSQVTRTVLELMEGQITEAGVVLDAELRPVVIRGDGELLRQALLNLVLNGVQAITESGSPSGRHLFVAVSQAGGAAVVQIMDQGIGIKSDVLPRIFDLYFTTKTTGSGIGLSMTYRIIQMHGGSLEVTSEAGAGSAFTVRLPLLRESRAETRNSLLAYNVTDPVISGGSF
jgi:signal transduction histidine kinase